jgi:hypothetical protein
MTGLLYRFFGIIIIRLSYGTGSIDDPRTRRLIKEADDLVREQALAFQPGRYLVGYDSSTYIFLVSVKLIHAQHLGRFMPWLQRVPAWLPGAGWKKRLEDLAQLNDHLVTEPFERLKTQLVSLKVALALQISVCSACTTNVAHWRPGGRSRVNAQRR